MATFDRFTDKIYQATLFGKKKKANANTQYNVVKPSKPYAEWNKPIIKDHWQVPIYLKCPKQEKLHKRRLVNREGEQESGQPCGCMNVSLAHLSLKHIQGTS